MNLIHSLSLKNTLSEENEIMSRCILYRFGLVLAFALLLPLGGKVHAEVASIYGGLMDFAVIGLRMASA